MNPSFAINFYFHCLWARGYILYHTGPLGFIKASFMAHYIFVNAPSFLKKNHSSILILLSWPSIYPLIFLICLIFWFVFKNLQIQLLISLSTSVNYWFIHFGLYCWRHIIFYDNSIFIHDWFFYQYLMSIFIVYIFPWFPFYPLLKSLS